VKVFIQGATGVLGCRLVAAFSAEGHEVAGATRSEAGERAVRERGGKPVRADVFDEKAMTEAAEGADVVIRAATHIPQKARVKPSDFAENARLRTEGTRVLLKAAVAVGARAFLQESIVWVAQPADGSPFTEESPVRPGPILDSMIQAEQMAQSAARDGPMTVTTLRLGNFYGPEAWHTRFIGDLLSKGEAPIMGTGDAQLSVVHVEDVASAFVVAAQRPREGLFHVVDQAPVRVRDQMNTLASLLGAPPPGHVSPLVARLFVGRYTVEFFTTPMITSNARFREAFGWAPKYPTFREGLEQVVAAWRAEKYLVK
jgi:nucleoside-diphosphate-sugar epimerase